MLQVLPHVLPVFAIIGVGFVLAGVDGFDRRTLSRLAIDVAGPCYIFILLANSTLTLGTSAHLIGGTLLALALPAILALAMIRGRWRDHRGLMLVVTYWNSGNLALSCSRLAFGPAGEEAAAVVFCITLVMHATLGVWTAHGGRDWGRVLHTPIFHAAWIGVAMKLPNVHLPPIVLTPISLLAGVTIPLLLLTLGMQLREFGLSEIRPALGAVLIRMGGGMLAMFMFVELFGVEGVARQVLLLNGVMPSAVINVALAERCNLDDTRMVASATLLGTVVSFVAIPVTLAWIS